MNLFKKEFKIKKSIGKTIIEATISSILFSIILYLLLNKYNTLIVELLNSIKEGNLSAFNVTLFLFPIILIISLTLGFVTLVINEEKK